MWGRSSATYSSSKSANAHFSGDVNDVSGHRWTETVLWSFTNGKDGFQPEAGLLRGKFGVLYGTTFYGGNEGANCTHKRGCGTVFKVTPKPLSSFPFRAALLPDREELVAPELAAWPRSFSLLRIGLTPLAASNSVSTQGISRR
jgi:hypothetical protein